MHVLTGIDRLVESKFGTLIGKSVGLVCNQGAIDSSLIYTLDRFRQAHIDGNIQLKAIFGPQHGLFGHTQDNMIEWEGGHLDSLTHAKIYSLYGEVREPTPAMLEGIDVIVLDLPDIGARYYTFIWTLFLCMKACAAAGIPICVLDRPNSLGGLAREGTVLQPEFESFVGLAPLPMRHGFTLGELAGYFKAHFYPELNLKIIEVQGWERSTLFPDTGLPWSMPSPNMSTFDTALVYPGMCLLEGTGLSEGRGTTHPFEIFGSPWLNAWTFAEELNRLDLPGVYFRPIEFQPTFQKFAGKVCSGAFLHVVKRNEFKPVLTAIAILSIAFKMDRWERFWSPPPYEYEFIKMPIDILAGNDWLRPAIEAGTDLESIQLKMEDEVKTFESTAAIDLLYP